MELTNDQMLTFEIDNLLFSLQIQCLTIGNCSPEMIDPKVTAVLQDDMLQQHACILNTYITTSDAVSSVITRIETAMQNWLTILYKVVYTTQDKCLYAAKDLMKDMLLAMIRVHKKMCI